MHASETHEAAAHLSQRHTMLTPDDPGSAPSSAPFTHQMPSGPPPPMTLRFWHALGRNLRAGLHLLWPRRNPQQDFIVSFDQVVALLIITLAAAAGLDRLTAEPGARFDSYGMYVWCYYLLAGFWGCALIARWQGRHANTRALLVAWLAVMPWFFAVMALVFLLPFTRNNPLIVVGIGGGLLLGVSERAVHSALGSRRWGTFALVALVVLGIPYGFNRLDVDPHLWIALDTQEDPERNAADRDAAESILFEESARIEAAVEAAAPARPALIDTYFLGFAGYGEQAVFRREALFAANVFARRLGTGTRSVELVNDVTDRDSYPLASVSGLRYALQLLGERMKRDSDMLVLFLTSHGSSDGILSVSNGGLPLTDLEPADLRSALDDSGIRWRIVIVSACYAGAFIEPLASPATLIITAADADHTSFGCADDRDLTYFGEAFLRDALPNAVSLEAAFTQARVLIEARENAENLAHSNPQMSVGAQIRARLEGLMSAPRQPIAAPARTASHPAASQSPNAAGSAIIASLEKP